MTTRRWVVISLLLTVLVWLVFAWPLPRHFARGIPMSSQNVEKYHARSMVPGDHLQLLYHFQLVHDFITGRIPWFHNVYEFNMGDDAARYMPGSYFVPFSLVYAAAVSIVSRAAAWNLVGFLSLWATLFAAGLYAARFTSRPVVAVTAALVSIALPFRWMNLLGGSPSGFAMMWVPVVALGTDELARSARLRGGVWAGAALLFACWGDIHVFFFVALSLPLWFLLGLMQTPGRTWFDRSRWRARVPGIAALGAFMVAAALYRGMRHAHIAASEMAGGRALREALIFSPRWQGFWLWAAEGVNSHIYIGYLLPLLLAAGAVTLFLRRSPESEPRAGYPRWTMAVLAVSFGGAMLLALGGRGPLDGLALRMVRTLIPPYAMIRQPAKIFVLMPTLIAAAGALSFDALVRSTALRRRGAGIAVLVAVLLVLAEYKAQVRPTICLLADRQDAYAAVAREDESAGQLPRALVLPIWPGESAEASVYEYFAQQYGIRMINGYSPVVSREYVEEAFRRLESANQGYLTDEQIDYLLSIGVRNLLFHENAFPEKVSPFPVSDALRRLARHPRVEPVVQADTVHAFRLLPPVAKKVPAHRPPVAFPARRFELEHGLKEGGETQADPEAGGGGFLRFVSGASKDAFVETKPARAAPAANLAWWIRSRGHGRVEAQTFWGEDEIGKQRVSLDDDDWTWQRVPIPDPARYDQARLRIEPVAGKVDLDLVLLVAGDWQLAPEKPVEIAAADLFHAGYTAEDGRAVVFRRDVDPLAAVLYGPKLPLAKGTYRIEVLHASDAPAGSELGRFNVRLSERDEAGWVPVRSGEPAGMEWVQEQTLPVNIVFVFERNHDMRVEAVRITPVARTSVSSTTGEGGSTESPSAR